MSQSIAAEEASLRRANVTENAAYRSEFATSRALERTVTSRQQRLFADKKSSRISKAK